MKFVCILKSSRNFKALKNGEEIRRYKNIPETMEFNEKLCVLFEPESRVLYLETQGS
jgi:hypothetical protein